MATFVGSFITLKDHDSFCIVHSTLIRASETCKIGFVSYTGSLLQTPLLNEANNLEHIIPITLHHRIRKFETYLSSMEKDLVVVVGHGQYFRKMLKIKESFSNCDMMKVEVTFTASSQGKSVIAEWGTCSECFRSPLSYVHPLNGLMRKVGMLPAKSLDEDKEDEVLSEIEVPTCRICQVRGVMFDNVVRKYSIVEHFMVWYGMVWWYIM